MTIRLGEKRAEDGGRLGGKEKQVFGTIFCFYSTCMIFKILKNNKISSMR